MGQITVGINKGPHDSAVSIFNDDELLMYIEAERLSNIKHDNKPFLALELARNQIPYVDNVVLAGMSETTTYDSYKTRDVYTSILCSYKSFTGRKLTVYDEFTEHHRNHASNAFYNSGFKEALCVVKDGVGSLRDLGNGFSGREISSAFVVTYPHSFRLIEKHVNVPVPFVEPKNWASQYVYASNSFSEAGAFEITATAFGFNHYDAGKIMGMAAYGKDDPNIPDLVTKDGLINPEIFCYDENNLEGFEDVKKLKFNYPVPEDFQGKANFAYKLQTQIQEHVANNILTLLKISKQKNLCLSGGFFLNCVSNNYLLKKLPQDVKVYVDPICLDSGTAIGTVRYINRLQTKDTQPKPLTNIYLGPKYKYSVEDLEGREHQVVKPADVASLLNDGKMVALYQGRSEAGPRALGNRSILFDPRNKDGKDYVNKVKKRESFRPFAGTVLLEKANDWFELRSLTESKYMMFALDVKEDKKELLPAITHKDGTCRAQTLSRDDNPHFYDLIKEFDNLTSVPVLLNTSFNLAGDALVETLQDALWTLDNSEIDYLYLPELGLLIK
jgi:carbamoyltransferase